MDLKSLLIEVLLTGLFFWLLMPKIKGARFTGSALEAFLYAAVFQLVMLGVQYALFLGAMLVGVATLGIGLIIVAFGIIFFFWMLPAVGLQVMAWAFPRSFGFDTWTPAILSGLVLLLISMISGDFNVSVKLN